MILNFIFFSLLLISKSYGQSITCNSNGCIPSLLQANVQEKVNYSAIDLGFTTVDVSVNSGTGSLTKQLRLNLSNGEFPGKNLNINLSGNSVNKNSGDIFVFADNIDTLNIQLNGYTGLNGLDASQICAQRVLASQYGEDVRLRFLQRRVNTSLSNDKCYQADIDDISQNKFSCNDSSYVSLNTLDPKINVTRIRKISKCQAVIPQNVCFQKKYEVTCSYRLKVTNAGITKFWDETKNEALGKIVEGGEFCQQKEECLNFPACSGNEYVEKNGSMVVNNSVVTPNQAGFSPIQQPYDLSKTYEFTQQELANYNSQPGSNICQKLINADSEWSPSNNNYHAYFHANGKSNYNGGRGCHQTESFNYITIDIPDSNISWETITVSPNIQEKTPGRDSSLVRLSGGTPFSNSPNGNGALRQTNSAGWQLEIMPAFYPSCNPYFSFITTETSNIVKSLFDPNLFNNESSFCINPNDSTNCSINPPFCDDPSNFSNCRKVSVCEKINKKYCLNASDPTNCSSPPFCDDPNGANCSSDLFDKSCNPLDSANSFCDKDPNNLGQFLFIGNEADPFKNTESFDCRSNSCQAEYKTIEQSLNLDTINPTNGQSGTLPGQGLFFVYDIRSVIQQSIPGQAGSGGKNDLSIPEEVRYCALKRDFTTDPNSKYENDPEITFKKILWKSLNVTGGGQPGEFPPYSSKKIEIFKKIDPAIRYLLKKELL